MTSKPIMPKFLLALTLTATLFFADADRNAAGAAWPEKPVKIVVAFDPGGTADRIARMLADKLTGRLRVQVFVENRGGASGAVGALFAARAAPDGHTLMIAGSGPHITAPVINPNAGYEPMRDFTHIAMIAGDTYVLAAGRHTPYASLADLVAAAKTAKPAISYGSPGAGSLGHLIMAHFVHVAGAPLTHVPYKGGGPAIKDVLGGHVATVLLPVLNVAELLAAGSIVPLAMTSTERHAAYPKIATFIEQGFRVQGTTWFWLAGPRGLPADMTERLETEVTAFLAMPDVRDSFQAQALLTKAFTRPLLEAFLSDEIALWRNTIKDIDFKLE